MPFPPSKSSPTHKAFLLLLAKLKHQLPCVPPLTVLALARLPPSLWTPEPVWPQHNHATWLCLICLTPPILSHNWELPRKGPILSQHRSVQGTCLASVSLLQELWLSIFFRMLLVARDRNLIWMSLSKKRKAVAGAREAGVELSWAAWVLGHFLFSHGSCHLLTSSLNGP